MSDGMTEAYKREEKASKPKKKPFCKKSHKYVDSDRSKELVDSHWDGYNGKFARKLAYLIAGLYGEVKDNDKFIEAILDYSEFVYKSSGVHFYGHCKEDMLNDN